MTLAEDLANWTDSDHAAFLLGSHLGAVSGDFATKNKHIFWTDNPLGNGLRAALHVLWMQRCLSAETNQTSSTAGPEAAGSDAPTVK